MPDFNWTGHPIVDTGLAITVIRAGKESPTEMSITDFQDVINDGQWLVHANTYLNAYVALFANGFLNRSQVKSMQNGSEQIKYQHILLALKEQLSITPNNSYQICECTGKFPAVNRFLKTLTQQLREKGILKESQKLDLGRNAFPLIGSLGNDAGALPAASREPNLSAFALLCAQMAPLAAVMLKGKVAFFQYTDTSLLLSHVETVYRETWSRVEIAQKDNKVEGYGSGGGTTRTVQLLLQEFSRLQRDLRILELPESVALNLWLVVNSGTNYDSELLEIPNLSLKFLWILAEKHYREVDALLAREDKRPANQLLECLVQKIDYQLLYSNKGIKPVSKELFTLYQTTVLDRSKIALAVAEWIAALLKSQLKDKKDKKLLDELKKFLFDSKDAKKLRPILRRLFADWSEQGWLNYQDYSALFPILQNQPIQIAQFGWKYIWFYLNHDDLTDIRPKFSEEALMQIDTQFRAKICSFAKDIFDYYVERHGIEKFQKRILNGFRDKKIRITHLQEWFINLGDSKSGYTNNDWDWLCRDAYGLNRITELLFQLRLELANLYRVHTNQLNKEKIN